MMSTCTDLEIDLTSICDVVLADLDNMMSTHIPFAHPTIKPLVPLPISQTPLTPHRTFNVSPSICMREATTNDCHTPAALHDTSSTSLPLSPGFMSVFRPEYPYRVELKEHVFISKDATFQLSRYIVNEEWGRDCVLLYKYLDYIFRCQLFSKQVFKLKHTQIGTYSGANITTEYLLFHTGLHRRRDHEYLFGLLATNCISRTHKNKQKWRVMFGNISESFLSQKELLIKFKGCNVPYLPQRTTFVESCMDSVFNPNYSLEVSWEERLIVNRDRVYRVIGQDAYFDSGRKHLKLSELIEAFDAALHATKRMLSFNPSLAVPQGFIDTKHSSFRMELLVPLIVKFPRNNGKSYTFALAISKSPDKMATYCVKSVLTLNMAYANARLVGSIESLWLKYQNK